MATKSTYQVLFRRRRSGKTNYAKRLDLLKGNKPRLVIRKTNSRLVLSLVEYHATGDKTIVFVDSRELSAFNWRSNPKNIPSAYLAGFLLGKRGLASGIRTAVLDIGLHTPSHGGRIFAAVKGAVDSGLAVPLGEDAIPNSQRLAGNHIAEYAGKIDAEKFKTQFSKALKAGFDPKKITSEFEQAKQAIAEKTPAQKDGKKTVDKTA